MKRIHRILVLTILLISFGWGLIVVGTSIFSFPESLGKLLENYILFCILMFGVACWGWFYIEIIDFLVCLSGENGKLYYQYAISIRKTILVSVLVAVLLASIYTFDVSRYDFASVDLGFIGIAFLMNSIYTLFQITKIRIAGKALKKIPIVIMLLIVIILGVLSYYVLLRISSGAFKAHQSIWFQLTILFGSFCAYTSIHLQLQMLKLGKLELSKFKKYFINDVIKSKSGIYTELEEPFKKINKDIVQQRARYSAVLRKNNKRKRRK